jgi:hypothetical protein
MRVGIENNTSYAVVNGTKTFTITGLDGKLTKQSFRSVVLQKSTGNIALINFAIDELDLLTLTLNTGVYTVGYGLLTRAASLPNLATGDKLAIEVLVDGESITVTSKLNTIDVKVDALQTSVDALGALVITQTQPEIFNTLSGYFNIRNRGVIQSFVGVTNFYINGILGSIGAAVEVNDLIRAIVPSTGTYNLVIRCVVGIDSSDTTKVAANKIVKLTQMYGAQYSPNYGIVKGLGQECYLDGNDNLLFPFCQTISRGIGGIYHYNDIFIEDSSYYYILRAAGASQNYIARVNKITSVYDFTATLSTNVTKIIKQGTDILVFRYSGSMYAYDISTFTLRATSPSLGNSFSSANNATYCYHALAAGNINVLQISDMQAGLGDPIAATGNFMFIASDGFLYAFSTNTIYKINTTTNTVTATLTWTGGVGYNVVEYSGYLYMASTANSKGINSIRLSDFTLIGASDATMVGCASCGLYSNYMIVGNTLGRLRSYSLSNGVATFIKETITTHSSINTMCVATPINSMVCGNYNAPTFSEYILTDLI